MKNDTNKRIMMTLLLMLIPFTYVKAECTNEEIATLKSKIENVNITYKHLDGYRDENGNYDHNRFDVKVKNIPEKFYVIIDENKYEKKENEEDIIINSMKNGRWKVDIYSNQCEELIDEINLKLPKFNQYHNDPLCTGIDGEDFAPCGKYYDYDISYEDFKQRVERYRHINKVDEKNNESKEDKTIFDVIFKSLNSNYIYGIAGMTFIIIISIIVIIYRKRKIRGVLK